MSVPAFFLSADAWSDAPTLAGDEARHANVLRVKPGDAVKLLDGEGGIADCRVAGMDKKNVALEILERLSVSRPKSLPVIALALSKATRRGFFFEKAAELGAAEIWLWRAEYSQGKLSAALADNYRGQVLAGCKQCQNPWMPQIRVLDDIDAIVRESAAADWRILPWEAQKGVAMLEPGELGRQGTTVYVIGPEGGFSHRELAAMKEANFQAVSLGHRVLRCETAATLCLGMHWWASQLPGHADFRRE